MAHEAIVGSGVDRADKDIEDRSTASMPAEDCLTASVDATKAAPGEEPEDVTETDVMQKN